ncbi:flagellar assembly protein T N-terminal domain-containing protein, partial [Oleiphilus sp. HI0086]
MKYFSFLLALMSCLLSPVSANAEWIQVTGQADFDGQRYDLARDRARQDALKQALLQAGARVKSDQRVSNGKISKDYFSVSGEARIRKSVLQDEFVKKGILNLVMNFDVEEVASCPDSQAKKYRKKIAVLGFSVQSPAQLRLGGFHNIERGLASALNQSLQLQDKLVVFEQSEFSLHQDVINAPSHFTSQSTLTKAADYAKQVGAQFVISGVVRDLSLEDPEAFSTSYWAKLKR